VELPEVVRRIVALEVDAQRLLAVHESAPARAISLEDSYRRLGRMSVQQDELFREALRAVEVGLFRASHVLAWAGFVDFLHVLVTVQGGAALQAVRPNWTVASAEDLRDYADYQVIETGKELGLYNKTVMKALHGLLNKRNEAAHPSDYFPNMNETLGYVSEIFHRVDRLK
jgi:hypothetical protein